MKRLPMRWRLRFTRRSRKLRISSRTLSIAASALRQLRPFCCAATNDAVGLHRVVANLKITTDHVREGTDCNQPLLRDGLGVRVDGYRGRSAHRRRNSRLGPIRVLASL